jgi:hypothetical protein
MRGLEQKIKSLLRRHDSRSDGDQCSDAKRRRTALSIALGIVAMCLGAALYRLAIADQPIKPAPVSAAALAQQTTQKFEAEKKAYWNQPKSGLLGGRVTGQDDAGFVLEDAKGISWYIATTESTPGLEYSQFLQSVRVKGEEGEEGYFIAKEIQPWEYKK